MQTGIVFDIREFCIHDGPGVRTTVFLKGCPLCCAWCHNPEGISPQPERIDTPSGARIVGQQYTSAKLASLLSAQADLLREAEGGVTFSGGEPLGQAAFVAEVLDRLRGIHLVLDTSGFGGEDDFQMLANRVDLVLFDLKLMDPVAHRRFTGQDNGPILRNLGRLATLTTPCVIRVPLVPGVTDTEENLSAVALAVAGMPNLVRIDLLRYNRAAGGKYAACGRQFRPTWDELKPSRSGIKCFEAAGVTVKMN